MKRKKLPGPSYTKRSGIYKISCSVTEDLYIGKSKNLHQRWCQHKHSLTTKTHPNQHLQMLYDTHGAHTFTMELIELVDDVTTLETREVYWIKTLNPNLNVTNTKLSESDVNDIRKLNEEKLPLQEIATKYNISVKYLLDILRGNRW